jgi:mono/diheme cytochrome c family protein
MTALGRRLFLCSFVLIVFGGETVLSQMVTIPDEVLDIFDEKCVDCHSGANAAAGLNLSEELAFASLVNKSSGRAQGMILVKPQSPSESYILKKVRGDAGIEGNKMPARGEELTAEQISVLAAWIQGIPPGSGVAMPAPEFERAFPGLRLATLPTTQTLESGKFSYRIAHRWNGEVVDSGFAGFYGLDGGASIMTSMSFAINNDFMFTVGRSNQNATFEFEGKWHFLREKSDGTSPFSAALNMGLDWATLKFLPGVGELGRSDKQRFHWFVQAPVSKAFGDRFAVLLVPGVLLNGNSSVSGEAAVMTVGFAGKLHISDGLSLFVEGVPIVTGADDVQPLGVFPDSEGEYVFHDAFTVGLEKHVGGHVFHLYITNSRALASDHYLSGGDLDFSDGEFRLGFNIYRELNMPF